MDKLQEEFLLLLKNFDRAKILDKFIVIGSWAKEIFMKNFPIRRSIIKTLDIDFSLINPKAFYHTSVNELLITYQYKPELTIHSKSITYFPATESNNLKIDFLCPYSRKITGPTNISGLDIVVTPLKYQDILVDNIVELPYRGLTVKVPSPEIWTIHKISISQQRIGHRLHRIAKEKSDLESTKEMIDFFGSGTLDSIAEERFKGRFLKFYEEGMQKLKSSEIDPDGDLNQSETGTGSAKL